MKFFEKAGQAAGRAQKRWNQSRHPLRDYWIAYTLLFLFLFSAIAAGFLIYGKSFVFEAKMGDGLRQHYVSLAYWGSYLREFLSNIFVEHTFSVPMWDVSIGYGTDILTTLHYYAIGDPLNLLSVFVPVKYTEYLYGFLMVFRMYLAGAAFSLYSLYHKNERFPTLMGAGLYAFSQWIMIAGFRHPFFMNPCIYFPLLILGVDKIFKKEKPYLYMIMVAVSAMSNFYYFYMLGIFVVIYAVYRYFMLFQKIRVKEIFGWLGKFAGFSTIGLMMSCVIFLPSILALMGTDRVGADNFIRPAYKTRYYHMLIPALFGKYQAHYTVIGISAVGVLGLFLLFTKRKRGMALKIGFLMCIGFLQFPFVAHMFNGFSYVTNRWCWALVMLNCYIFVKMYPELFALSKKRRGVIFGVLTTLAVYICFDRYASDSWNIIGVAILLAVCAVLFGGYSYFKKYRALTGALVLGAVCLGTFLNIYYCFTSAGNPDSGIWKYADFGTVYEKNTGPVIARLKEQEDIMDYRYEQGGARIPQNSPMLTGLKGGQFFFSLANGNVSRFINELYSNKPLEQSYQDVNGRAFLMKLLSMKYFVGQEEYKPYGFEKIDQLYLKGNGGNLAADTDMVETEEVTEEEQGALETSARTGKQVGVYEDKNALPLTYTYDTHIPSDVYEKMPVMEKQQAILQGVVLENSDLPISETEDISVEKEYTLTPLKDCELFNNRIKAKAAGATCLLEFEGVPESELYVAFDNLQYLEVNRRHKYSDEEWKALPFMERREISIKDESVEDQVRIAMSAMMDGKKVSKGLSMVTSKNNFYNGRHNFMNNMGYSKEPVTQILLTFDKKGSYAYDDLSVYFQPMKNLDTYASARKEDVAENLVIGDNKVSCNISLDTPKALVFSLPYSDGWTAEVDGKEAELKRANTMFMAVELTSGDHEIELHYTTPYAKLGLLLSVCGVVLLLGVIVVDKKKRKTA